MITEEKTIPRNEDITFETMLDSALERVWNKKAQFSIKRLREMEAELLIMEKELDIFLSSMGRSA